MILLTLPEVLAVLSRHNQNKRFEVYTFFLPRKQGTRVTVSPEQMVKLCDDLKDELII